MDYSKYKEAILPQQAKFAEEYVAMNFNATRAAIAAGYSEKTACAQASKLLRNVNIMAYVQAMTTERSANTESTIDKQRWRMEAISNADIRDYIIFDGKTIRFKSFDEMTDEQRYAIKGIKNGKNGIEITLHDKSWSIEMLNKHLGIYEKDNKQKGEGLIEAVGILLPDNNRGKVVPNLSEDAKEP